ncbi:MAG: hypothetical protein QXN40_06365 [Candidatus Bathyarchaeia archaeon]
MRNEKEIVQVSFRIPRSLKEVIQAYLRHDLHMNLSDFLGMLLERKFKEMLLNFIVNFFRRGKLNDSYY